MSTQKAISSAGQVNNGGSILSGGNNTALNTVAHGTVKVQSMKPVDGVDTNKALSSGSFAYDSVGSEIVAKKVTTELAGGVSNTFLRSGAAVPGERRKVNKIEGLKTSKVTTALRTGKYNHVTGAFDNGYPQASDDSFGNDDATTAAELQFMYGSTVPGNAEYGADNTTSSL